MKKLTHNFKGVDFNITIPEPRYRFCKCKLVFTINNIRYNHEISASYDFITYEPKYLDCICEMTFNRFESKYMAKGKSAFAMARIV